MQAKRVVMWRMIGPTSLSPSPISTLILHPIPPLSIYLHLYLYLYITSEEVNQEINILLITFLASYLSKGLKHYIIKICLYTFHRVHTNVLKTLSQNG